jgi:hypothetical protein
MWNELIVGFMILSWRFIGFMTYLLFSKQGQD